MIDVDRLEPWWQEIDVVRVGLEGASNYTQWLYLYPFKVDDKINPFSHENMAERIKLVDSAILLMIRV